MEEEEEERRRNLSGMEIDMNSSSSIFMKIYKDLLLQPSAERAKHTASALGMARRSLSDAAFMWAVTGISTPGDIRNTFNSLGATARSSAGVRSKIGAGLNILRQSPSARWGAFFGALVLVSDLGRVALDRVRGHSNRRVWEDLAINTTATSLLLARSGPLVAISGGLGYGAIDASFYAFLLEIDRRHPPLTKAQDP